MHQTGVRRLCAHINGKLINSLSEHKWHGFSEVAKLAGTAMQITDPRNARLFLSARGSRAALSCSSAGMTEMQMHKLFCSWSNHLVGRSLPRSLSGKVVASAAHFLLVLVMLELLILFAVCV